MSTRVWPTIVMDASVADASDASFFGWTQGLSAAARLVTYFARADGGGGAVLTIVFEDRGALVARRLRVTPGQHLASRATADPAFAVFEREMAETLGLCFDGHPWPKPVRADSERLGTMKDFPFFRVDGKEVHEVAVGPIHAGVIEPGHFRFMCHGEEVVHLEIHLGYQHRGVLELCKRKNLLALTPLIETVAGDTSVAHAWAFAQAVEACAATQVSPAISWSRAVALELERIAMHLVGLAGLCTDVGFLPGGSTYGRLRTAIINSTMLACGSRFGHGWIRPGASRGKLTAETRQELLQTLARFCRDFETVTDHFAAASTVRHRLAGTGVLSGEVATQLGIVGLAARASGRAIDQRLYAERPYYSDLGWTVCAFPEGDCSARARVRIEEIRRSAAWLQRALAGGEPMAPAAEPVAALQPNKLVASLVEGFRGECVHCLETDEQGKVIDYRVQDPSLRNWFGLAQAVRGNPIYDFPICNKSFDLSYCGNDL